MRTATINRTTSETTISLTLDLDGTGQPDINTGIAFFDHMLTLWAKHSGIDLTLKATGDIKVDAHHTVEDVGICLGQALKQSLGDKKGISRYGFFILPMDETLCTTALDFSNRPHLDFAATYPQPKTGDFDAPLAQEFFKAVVNNAGLTLHIKVDKGDNVHHIIEAIFKSFARSVKMAIAITGDINSIPSTKGLL